MIITLVAFLATIAFLILVHEGGHFLVAKLAKVWVHQFAIGFGPAIWRYKRKETEYSIRIFPLGGYVKMAGEDKEEENQSIPKERLFTSKKPFARMAIVSAGPLMNILAALVLMIIVVGAIGIPYLEITGFTEDSSAKPALKIGDKIVRIEGRDIYSAAQVNRLIQSKSGMPVNIEIMRGSQNLKFTITPKWDSSSGRYLLGVTFPRFASSTTNKIRSLSRGSFLAEQGLVAKDSIVQANGEEITSFFSFLDAVKKAIEGDGRLLLTVKRESSFFNLNLELTGKTWPEVVEGVQPELVARRPGFLASFTVGTSRIWDTLVVFYLSLRAIFAGQIAPGEALSGPIGIASFLGESLKGGLLPFFTLVVILSLNLGIINLIPFPGLDGSRLGFITYEMIRGKPIPPEKEGWVHYIGFMILIGLMILITYKDILKLLR